MPASQSAATERRNEHAVTHEPPKLKTTLKTPPKQATNPLQFVKVGPCSLYRTAQEQLQKVQEVKKIKQEVRDDPEDWQSNLDNWKSSRRKRQEHIIERVVEAKKLELEEHSRQRRKSKTFSEMIEERSSRGRKLSISLAIYNEEDTNDLSDLGIGTSSGKSSVSGDTHDDTHSVLSDRDSEIEKNHSDVDNAIGENGTDNLDTTKSNSNNSNNTFGNGFIKKVNSQEYDSATTATVSSPEPEEYTYEGAIRGYVSRVAQNIPRKSLVSLDTKFDVTSTMPATNNTDDKSAIPVVKVDILKRREIFEKASQMQSNEIKVNNRLPEVELIQTKSIKERLTNLEKIKSESDKAEKKPSVPCLSTEISSVRERLSNLGKQDKVVTNNYHQNNHSIPEELENVRPLKERLLTLKEYEQLNTSNNSNGIKERKCTEKKTSMMKQPICYTEQDVGRNNDTSTPSERSSSPDSEYRGTQGASRAPFHRSLDSLDADGSSGPDTFERVQSLEELDYRRYPASSSSAEILNDTDREDSGIHTADVSCSVSQADESVDDDIHNNTVIEIIAEKKQESFSLEEEPNSINRREQVNVKETADTSTGDIVTSKCQSQSNIDNTNIYTPRSSSSSRPIVYQSPKVPPRRSPPETLSAKYPTSLQCSQTNSPTSDETRNIAPLKVAMLRSSSSQSDDFTKIPTLKPLPLRREQTDLSKSENSDIISLSSDSPESPNHSPNQLLSPIIVDGILKTVPKLNQSESNQISDDKCSLSPRSPSKIPTPLPRKSLSSSSSSSSSATTTPTSPSSPKIPLSPKPRTIKSPNGSPLCSARNFPSEIPIPVTNVASSPKSPERLPRLPPIPTNSSSLSNKTGLPMVEDAHRTGTQVLDIDDQIREKNKVLITTSPSKVQSLVVKRPEDEEPINEGVMAEEGMKQTNGATSEREESIKQNATATAAVLHNKEVKETSSLLTTTAVKKVKEITFEDEESKKSSFTTLPELFDRPTNLDLSSPIMHTEHLTDLLSPLSPVSTHILPLSLSSDEEIVTGLTFPLGPPTSVEPPKEKPPPPPTDFSDDENHPIEPLKRLNSTRRIKKEMRSRRSDFLGIEGINDDELERELIISKPPDMAAILAEERRVEQLHRRSYDTDSNYDQDSSHERDSGVELGHVEDWTKQPVSPDMSQHSRQSSEPFGASITSSEEDEIQKKEREMIDVLEKDEEWNYGNNREINGNIGEKLEHKLRVLEEENIQLEREREQEEEGRRQGETLRKNEENIRKQEEVKRKQQDELTKSQQQQQQQQQQNDDELEKKEKRQEEELILQKHELRVQRQEEVQLRNSDKNIREEENAVLNNGRKCQEDDFSAGEVFRVEQELLQLEQEELKRQRSNLVYREQKQLAERWQEQWKSLQDVTNNSTNRSIQQYKLETPLNYRASMPNLQLQEGQRRRPPPPPIPPTKPLRLLDQRQRDNTIRNSRIPSADSIPQQVDASLRHSASVTTLSSHAGQQMSRQTLQALSAAPRPRIVQGDQWVQRRKSDVPRGAHDFNYQHWLIQEAEQRRINEINQRSPIRKTQQHVTGTSVPYVASSSRSDNKPLPDSIIQTLTQRVQNRVQEKPLPPRRRFEPAVSHEQQVHQQATQHYAMQQPRAHQPSTVESQEKMLSVSGKKKCSHCGDELGRGAAMIIESLRLFYHMECFKCCVCHVRLGDGLMGTDVRVRNHKLHCHNCYSSDDGVKFSCV